MSEQTKTTTQIYAEQLKAAMADNQRLRDSLVKHFEDEHLAGDGPEIDRWRTENRRLKAEMEQTAERANREAQLACDLRTSQDEVIERCAKAVEEWPEAAARLRQHCGNSDETAVSGEDFGELRRQLQASNLEHERSREWAAGQIKQARTELDAARLKMDSWVGDLEGIEADPVKGDPGTTVSLVIKSINRQIEIMTAKKP